MSQRFARAFAWTVDYPAVTSLLILVVSGLAIVGYVDPELLTNWSVAAPTETGGEPVRSAPKPKRASPPAIEKFDLADADVVLVVDGENFFTAEGAATLRRMVYELERLDYVESVLWMDRVPVLNVFGLREPLFPPEKSSERQFAAAREKALKHPLVGGELLSGDGCTLLMLIKLNWLFVESDADSTDGIKAAAAEAFTSDCRYDLHVTGRVPMYLAYMESQRKNQRKYQIIGYSMTGLMALILFRGLRSVLIVSLAPALGVFWSLGMLQFFDVRDNPFVDVVLPVLLSLVGLTDGVHLMVEIRKQNAAGLSERDAAREGIGKIGIACALTSLTTAIGFASLGLAHHEIVREFGWSCVLGVGMTFLAVITTIPLACRTRLGRNLHIGLETGFVERQLDRISWLIEFVLRRSRQMSGIAVVATVVLVLTSLQLRPDEKRSSSLPSGTEPVVALEHMDKAFGGLERGYVGVGWPEEAGPAPAEMITVLGEVTELLESEPLLGHPLSIHSLLSALPGDGPVEHRASMLELLPANLKRAFYSPERPSAKVTFRVQDLGIAAYGPVFERVQAGLREIEARHSGYNVYLSGDAVSRWRNLYQIVVDLTSSLGSAGVVIFVVLMIAYRSVRIGLIAIVPNLFPLAVTGAFLVLTGQSLEIVSVCAFTVCLGIAVDDTIHFLTRYQEERLSADRTQAIRRAFTGTGTALIMTTIVLVTGFSTVLFSDLREQRIFAAMGGLTIAAALFADLVFLPALMARFAERADETPTADVPPSQQPAQR